MTPRKGCNRDRAPGRGIGRGIAKVFAAEGAAVAVAFRSQKTVEEVVREIRADGFIPVGMEPRIDSRRSSAGSECVAP
jgi:NAD(P)-dependent dehydrogenase (short-subunit alcohol dehydrogenase family)